MLYSSALMSALFVSPVLTVEMMDGPEGWMKRSSQAQEIQDRDSSVASGHSVEAWGLHFRGAESCLHCFDFKLQVIITDGLTQ